jgi:hypothetical protein
LYLNLLALASQPLVESLAKMDYNEWIKIGIDAGWCGPAVCFTHDGLPMSLEEEALWEEESCIHVIRLYEDDEMKQAIEDNHSPSLWRR